MRQALRVLSLAFATTLGLYALLWAATAVWDTPVSASTIDSPRGLTDLYGRPVREFGYRLPAFCATAREQRKLLFIGGSVSQAYRPDIIGRSLPGWSVSDVSLDNANITEMRQAFRLMRDCLGADGLRGSMIVLAINFLQFVPNRVSWQTPYTYLELDLLRHGLFDGPPNAVSPVLPWQWLPTTVSVMRPVLAAYGISYQFSVELEDFLHRRFGVRGLPDPGHTRQLQDMIRKFDGTDPSILAEQAAELDGLLGDIHAAGADAVILDMPFEGWLRDGMPQFGVYRDWMTAYVKRTGVRYIDHVYRGNDGEFRDGYHALPVAEPRWSALAVEALRSVPGITLR